MNDPPAERLRANKEMPLPELEQRLPGHSEEDDAAIGAEEVDVWWGAYTGRAMWPSFVVCVLLTGLVAALAWHFYDAYRAHPRLMRYLAYGLTGIVWLVQLGRWCYRTVGLTYRLTTRRLFRDHGFHHPDAGWVELPRLRVVEVAYGPFERKLGIGRLYVYSEGDMPPPLVLEAVHDPQGVAALITQTAQEARRRLQRNPPS